MFKERYTEGLFAPRLASGEESATLPSQLPASIAVSAPGLRLVAGPKGVYAVKG